MAREARVNRAPITARACCMGSKTKCNVAFIGYAGIFQV